MAKQSNKSEKTAEQPKKAVETPKTPPQAAPKPQVKAPVLGGILCPTCKKVGCYNRRKHAGVMVNHCGRYAPQ